MNVNETGIAAARLIVVVALISWALAGCSAIELYQQSATTTSDAQAVATAAPEDATRAALEAAHEAAQATVQALEQVATSAAAAIATLAVAPTTAPAAAPPPASAEAVVYGSVPIDSDRLNIIAALAIDAGGRLLAATRAGEIYAMLDRDGDGFADETRLIFADEEEQLRQTAGLIAIGDGLILLNGARLSLLTDGDGDGVYETVTHLSEGLPADQSPLQANNSIVQAPDGRLFSANINTGEILRIILRE